jgi:predicted RNA-binding protein with PIN domain
VSDTLRDDASPALPDPVRRRVLETAASALGALDPQDVPPALARVRSFAPARRADRGAVPLLAALERDEAFRARVASAVRVECPEPASAVASWAESGEVPEGPDAVEVAAAAYLLRPQRWQALVDAAARALAEAEQARVARDGDAELARLRAELASAREDRGRAEAAARREVAALQEELAEVRRELRRHRSDADRARAQARATQARAEQDVEAAAREVAAAQERAARAEADLRAARDDVTSRRRAEREGRSLAGARARLLLDTVLEAAAGLRHELALPPAGLAPADLVGEEEPQGAAVAARARADDDPAVLDELLRLPRAHLVVDGYNVTKSAYGELPLADQRSRLLSALSALAARTRAEITCCFDGTDLPGRTPTPSVRGVRVRFSAADEIADDLIRRLVRAEPAGRVVVVVSSDREVAHDVRAAGARSVPSAALVRLLGRS